ncbi:MAG: hypothetical protein K6A41_08760 [Bacteroidales bacterium]|nr:hypothetical protein [Bacteroidales bacterium]
MKNTIKIITIMILAVIVTACKPERKELSGTWRWIQTSGGFAGDLYTPATEGFEAEIVFKGNRFTFYKSGEKIASGLYQINTDVDMPIFINSDDGHIVWFSLTFPEAQCKDIMEATGNKIPLFVKSVAVISEDSFKNQILTLSDNCYDGYSISFVKPHESQGIELLD